MNTVVTIYGSSDDLIEIDGPCQGCDEYNAEKATFLVGGEDGRIHVTVAYGKDGLWAITVAPTAEDAPMLPVEFPSKLLPNGYSAVANVLGVDHVVRVYDA